MPEQNKVKFGLKNVYYSKVTETTDSETGAVTSSYSTPARWPGAVSIAQDPQSSRNVFRADNSDYYVTDKNGGFSGALVVAMIPDDVREYCFGVRRDNNGVLVEDGKSGLETKYLAIMFQFEGDKKAIRHLLYKCSLSRPGIGSETTPEGDTPNVQTVSTTITAVPRADADELCHLEADPLTDSSVYDNWFTSVYIPAEDEQYKLTKTQGANTTLTVKRNNVELADNADLAAGDVLTITCEGGTITVNDVAFISGSTYTVSGNTVVVSTHAE